MGARARVEPLIDSGFAATCSVTGIPDLIVAAAAEGAELTVLHYDSDFELIATVTGQEVEWVVPRGSVD